MRMLSQGLFKELGETFLLLAMAGITVILYLGLALVLVGAMR